MTEREKSIALLERIAKGIDRLVAIAERRQTTRADSSAPAVASDSDLDGPHGDPNVRFDPRDWKGRPSCKGLPLSQCPPEFLDMLAESFDFFAGKESDEKKARYNRMDAARARGWAARMRSGTHAAPVEAESDGFVSEGSGFASEGDGRSW